MKKINVCVLDYGSGNVMSVFNILKTLASNVIVSNKPSHIKNSSHLILPGVGAFQTSMEKIRKNIPVSIIEKEVLKNNKPFLGICVGMQVLADTGLEFGAYKGLGWVSGKVVKMKTKGLPLPHVGWNSIVITKKTKLTERFPPQPDFYFVHSYVFKPKNLDYIVAKTEYGEEFCSIIAKRNIFGVQFHPEKSQKAGKVLLENFLEI